MALLRLRRWETGSCSLACAAPSSQLGKYSRSLRALLCLRRGSAAGSLAPRLAAGAWPGCAWLYGSTFWRRQRPAGRGAGRGLGRPADGYARARAGVAKATLMKRLVQYMLSDVVQGNASAYQYAPMSQDTVRPRAAGRRGATRAGAGQPVCGVARLAHAARHGGRSLAATVHAG